MHRQDGQRDAARRPSPACTSICRRRLLAGPWCLAWTRVAFAIGQSGAAPSHVVACLVLRSGFCQLASWALRRRSVDAPRATLTAELRRGPVLPSPRAGRRLRLRSPRGADRAAGGAARDVAAAGARSATGRVEHARVARSGRFLRAGDLLVVNDTRVFAGAAARPARAERRGGRVPAAVAACRRPRRRRGRVRRADAPGPEAEAGRAGAVRRDRRAR